ncbi:MAG: sugar kinase, partial [Cyanobacteria bacterium]|nr:sugar kinase [Cyanobacteriota bacterium]
TRFGQDAFAQGLKKILAAESIDSRLCKTVPGRTGVYFCSVLENGERDFLYYRDASAASTLSPEDIRPLLFKDIHYQALQLVFATGITQAISASSRKTVLKAFQLAKENGILTAFDPNYRQRLWPHTETALDAYNAILPYVDILLPSTPGDTVPVFGLEKPEQLIEYFWLKGVKLVVVKAGEKGCYVGYKKKIEHLAANSVKVMDTTGAGDAFNGGFLHGITAGVDVIDCARLGITTAGFNVQRRGALNGLPRRDAVYSVVFPTGMETAPP